MFVTFSKFTISVRGGHCRLLAPAATGRHSAKAFAVLILAGALFLTSTSPSWRSLHGCGNKWDRQTIYKLIAKDNSVLSIHRVRLLGNNTRRRQQDISDVILVWPRRMFAVPVRKHDSTFIILSLLTTTYLATGLSKAFNKRRSLTCKASYYSCLLDRASSW
jgi:hypothetical protein